MKKINKSKYPIYAFAAFGANLMMLVVSVYVVDAFSTAGFVQNVESWTFSNKTIVIASVFSLLVTIAKIIDGFIDIPLAHFTDNLKTKWGKRRPSIIISLLPLVLSYLGLIFPLSDVEGSMLNTIWAFVMLTIFFSSYTLLMVSYYATFSEVTEDESGRVSLSNWKAFYDTIGYSIAYALIPLFVGLSLNIQIVALAIFPLIFTMIIPLIMIKEPSNKGAQKEAKEESVPMFKSLKHAFSNKHFRKWMLVFGMFYFGLQLFLVSQNVYASGPMGLNGWQIAIMNTAAFAPVPIMLLIYRKVMASKGFKFAFQTAMLSFAFAMIFFGIAYVNFIPSVYIRLAIGTTGATIGSYGIGAFFSAPYLIPSQIAAEETKKGVNNPAMFFAVQGAINAIVGAISTGLLWLTLKEFQPASNPLLGTYLSIFVIAAACMIAFFFSFTMKSPFTEIGKKQKDTTNS